MVNYQLEHVRPQILTIPKIIQVDKCGALSLIQFKNRKKNSGGKIEAA